MRRVRTGEISLILPWPPSINHYWRNVGLKVLISRKGREYRKEVAGIVLASRPRRTLEGRLAVDIRLYPPDRRRRDIDNTLKAILDSLEAAGIYVDDSQIDKLTVERLAVRSPGTVAVGIRTL